MSKTRRDILILKERLFKTSISQQNPVWNVYVGVNSELRGEPRWGLEEPCCGDAVLRRSRLVVRTWDSAPADSGSP